MTKPKPPSASNSYKILVRKISKEFAQMEAFLKNRIAQGHWKVGRDIHEHLLKHEKRAKHGAAFYEELAEDTGRDPTTLSRAVQFYRAYPILARGQELTWSHYRTLITIKDEQKRKNLEKEIIRKDWDAQQLRQHLSQRREIENKIDLAKPVPQLKFTRGRLQTYQIVKANKPLVLESPLVMDLGFRLQDVLPSGTEKFLENDVVALIQEGGLSVRKITISPDELFTYKACVDRVIDGDTLLVSFDFGLKISLSQKLRLRGIDCPEMDTEEGKRAKRFVESRLKPCEFIIVKTYKDRSDKFDRYLADVFYKAGESDSAIVAAEGKFLNQELLDERLAVRYEL
ncbi:MAG TPA: DUF1016 N-terminal domain-containing protein [Candidatus Omnitrophota bacterium]|nr:DUF1016 N-terminal domain-containing protein [Candidatus Omnitrophota bacterium]